MVQSSDWNVSLCRLVQFAAEIINEKYGGVTSTTRHLLVNERWGWDLMGIELEYLVLLLKSFINSIEWWRLPVLQAIARVHARVNKLANSLSCSEGLVLVIMSKVLSLIFWYSHYFSSSTKIEHFKED